MGGVLGEPVEPKINWDEEGEDCNSLARGEVKPLPEPFAETVEGVEIIEESDTSGVKLRSNSVRVVVPDPIPAVPRSSNGAEEPHLHSLHGESGSHEHTEEVSQISSDDGVRVLKRRSEHPVRTITKTVSGASWLIDVELLFVCTL